MFPRVMAAGRLGLALGLSFMLLLLPAVCHAELEGGSPAPAAAASILTGSVYAVIAGIDYDDSDPRFRALQFCEADALNLERTLRASNDLLHRNQNVTALTSRSDPPADANGIIQSLQDYAVIADERDTLLFYFTGHGWTDGIDSYLVTQHYDAGRLAQGIPPREWVAINEVLSTMKRSSAGRKLVILDACHSSSADPWTLQHWQASGIFLLSSCQAQQQSLEDAALGGGVFTHFLCQGLGGEADYDRNGVVSLAELRVFLQPSINGYLAAAYPDHPEYVMQPRFIEPTSEELPLTVVNTARLAGASGKSEESILQQQQELNKLEQAKQILAPQLTPTGRAGIEGSGMKGKGTLDQAEFSWWYSAVELPKVEISTAVNLLQDYLASDAAHRRDPRAYRYMGLALTMLAHENALVRPGDTLGANLDTALEAYDQSLALDPDNVDTVLGKALTLSLAERPQEALAQLEAARRLAPASPVVQFALGTYLTDQGEYDSAIEALEAALALAPDYAAAHFQLGIVYRSMGEQGKAIKEFEDAIALETTNSYFRMWLATTYRTVGNYDKSAQVLFDSLLIDPEFRGTYGSLATLAGLQGNHLLALSCYEASFRKVIEEPSGSSSTPDALIKKLMALGEIERAEAILQESLAAFPRSTSVMIALGDKRQADGNWQAAIDAYTRALEMVGADDAFSRVSILNELAGARAANNEFPIAVNLLLEALDLDPAGTEHWLDLSTCLFALNDPQLQTSVVKQLSSVASRKVEGQSEADADAALNLATFLLSLGEVDAGAVQAAVVQALEGKPTRGVLYEFGIQSAERAQWPQAIAAFQQALGSEVSNSLPLRPEIKASYLDAFGRAQLASGDSLAALENLSEATRLDSAQTSYWLNLGRCQLVLGEIHSSRASLARVMNMAQAIANDEGATLDEKKQAEHDGTSALEEWPQLPTQAGQPSGSEGFPLP